MLELFVVILQSNVIFFIKFERNIITLNKPHSKVFIKWRYLSFEYLCFIFIIKDDIWDLWLINFFCYIIIIINPNW